MGAADPGNLGHLEPILRREGRLQAATGWTFPSDRPGNPPPAPGQPSAHVEIIGIAALSQPEPPVSFHRSELRPVVVAALMTMRR
jgi:hypothetical protein